MNARAWATCVALLALLAFAVPVARADEDALSAALRQVV